MTFPKIDVHTVVLDFAFIQIFFENRKEFIHSFCKLLEHESIISYNYQIFLMYFLCGLRYSGEAVNVSQQTWQVFCATSSKFCVTCIA